AGLIQGLSEALHFAEQAELDVRKVVDVISKGAAQSWQMENRSGTMIDGHFEHGFAVDWMRKDLGICLEEARRNGARLPVAALGYFVAHPAASQELNSGLRTRPHQAGYYFVLSLGTQRPFSYQADQPVALPSSSDITYCSLDFRL